MTKLIYFDHAATSWPKPFSVRAALDRYFGQAGGNPGRSGHRMSIAAAQVAEEARDAVAVLLGVADARQIVFTKNATEALNLAIYGLLGPTDHAVTTSVEHNSVMRPLRHLESLGMELSVVACAEDGTLDITEVVRALRPETRLLVTVHGSNVTGAVLPIGRLAAEARERGVPYLVDAAQTAGAVPLDIGALGVDMLAFTGHKALLGPTGTGGLFVREGLSPRPITRGGTGSRSDLELQPEFMPDRYESGTLNVAGLAGLSAAVHHLLDVGVENVHDHELMLVRRFLARAGRIPGLSVYGPRDPTWRCGVVSFNVAGLASSEVATILDRDYSIMSRPGLHCAPGAHRTISTFPTGAVRFSFGMSNTASEVDAALHALEEVADWAASRESDG